MPKSNERALTAELLRELLHYAPDTGVFTWKVRAAHRIQIGDVAGCPSGQYINIKVRGLLYKAHRLAWLYVHGVWPRQHLDHINGVGSDNRIANLREATQRENLQNVGKRATNTSGYPGVSWFKPAALWVAEITTNRKKTHLGYFKRAEDAAAAYRQAKRQQHTFAPEVREC